MIHQKILLASKELFLKYGIKSVSMDDIARHLGVSKKTIYQHVLNKKNLVEEVFIHHVKLEEETISFIINNSKDAIDELVQIGEFILAFLKVMKPSLTYDLQKYHKETWQIMEAKHFQFIEDTMRTNLERGIKEGLYRSTLNTDIVAMIYMLKMKYIINHTVTVQQNYEIPTVYKEFISQHLYSIINKSSFNILEQYIKKLNS